MKIKKSVRLPVHVIPKHYEITLKPDLEQFTFEGEETIDLSIAKQTKTITLHSFEIDIISAEFIHKSKDLWAGKITYNEEEETATFTFSKQISKGEGKLKLKFTGILNDKMRGFYRSRYEVGGKTHHMAVTQFEATDARRAFPCFDEPALKSTFNVKLMTPPGHIAISNTLEEEILEHEAGYKVFSFSATPKMSTYLLAFIVGKFEHIETKTKEGVKVRVFVAPGKKNQAAFALDVAAKTLSFFANYFQIPYPLPTLDLIAIPDFASGAMENWGAVTYRETALLVDEEQSSTANKQWVALVIAHELAHQWFGNLVTLEWWTHLWLNEGFASYIEYFAIDYIFPKWNIWTQFVYLDHARALQLDSLKNTHPIEVEVGHPNEISEIFDAVSYSKGASIIRMLAEYLGEKDFRLGLVHYLRKHSYGNASTDDLWKSLEVVSKKPVRKIMKNWTGESGYPLLTISGKGERLLVSQSRFFQSPLSKRKSKDKTLWQVPFSVKSSLTKKPQTVLLSKKTMQIQKPKQAAWIKLNTGETSVVRVLYPQAYLHLLEKPIQNKQLSIEDRFGIIRDAFAFAQAGEISTTDALRMSLLYTKEDNYVVWTEIATHLSVLSNLFVAEDFYEKYKMFCQTIFLPITQKVGWHKQKGESHFQTLVRSLAIFSLGTYGDKKIIRKAQELFRAKVLKGGKLDSDLRSVVYNLVAQNGTEIEYVSLKKLFDQTPFQEEKDRLLRALCAFKQEKLLKKTLEFAFSDKVRSQDPAKAINFAFSNIYGRVVAWGFLKNHWEVIVKRYSGGHIFTKFITPVANLTKKEDAKDVKKFFRKNPAPGGERTIAQVLEQIYSNAAWLSRDRKRIQPFLQTYR